MSKIGTILHAIGAGAEAAAGPVSIANPAIGAALHIGGAALGATPHPATNDATPDTLHGIAVQTVLDNIGVFIATYAHGGVGEPFSETLASYSAEIEKWLTAEASRYIPSK